jgi:hypothetical protein
MPDVTGKMAGVRDFCPRKKDNHEIFGEIA